jgi:hypothetical protein
MEEMNNVYKILIGQPEGNRQLGRPRCRQEDNIKRDIKEVWMEDVLWILDSQGLHSKEFVSSKLVNESISLQLLM